MNLKRVLTLQLLFFSLLGHGADDLTVSDHHVESILEMNALTSSSYECVYYAHSPRVAYPFGTFIRNTCTDARVTCRDYLGTSSSRSDWSCESFKYWPSRASCSYELRRDGQRVKEYKIEAYGKYDYAAKSNACRFAKDRCERSRGTNGFCRKLN